MPTRPEDPTIHLSVTASATPEEIADRILSAYAERSATPAVDLSPAERLLARIDEIAHDLPELWQDTPLTVEQAARAHVVESAPFPITSVQDVLDVAEWIATGVRPLPIELLDDRPEARVLPVPEVTAEPVRVDPAEVVTPGTLVAAQYEGRPVRAFLCGTSVRYRWAISYPDGCYTWAQDGELSDVVLLHSGELDPFQ